ncbi:unnamed protein product [Malus baccata var. baccata]
MASSSKKSKSIKFATKKKANNSSKCTTAFWAITMAFCCVTILPFLIFLLPLYLLRVIKSVVRGDLNTLEFQMLHSIRLSLDDHYYFMARASLA